MPIFEYKCLDCGAMFEILVRNQTEKINCQRCSSSHLERLISMFRIASGRGGDNYHPSSSASKCSGCSSVSCQTCH